MTSNEIIVRLPDLASFPPLALDLARGVGLWLMLMLIAMLIYNIGQCINHCEDGWPALRRHVLGVTLFPLAIIVLAINLHYLGDAINAANYRRANGTIHHIKLPERPR